jgi:hypothetical protein
MEKLTVPGLSRVDDPLAVLSVNHGTGGVTAAVQVTGALPETLTRKDPLVLPGGFPATARNCDPAGLRVIVAFVAISREMGTLIDPAEDVTVIVLV